MSDLKADFASFEVGVSASFGASLNLLGSALKLLQGIYGAVESGQREQALKRFARIHVHDIEYSLALLDGRVDAPPSNASSVPSLETLREISLPANTTYADMLNKLRAASAHCGFAVYVELQTADTISLAQRYQNAELVLDSIKTFRSVRGTDGNALIKELTTLYRNYFKALEQGASSGAELLDSLSSTQSKISNLLGLWDNFQKARSGE